MRKVKVIVNTSAEWFERNINSFLAEHKGNVSDIQFRPTSDERGKIIYNAMISYREIER